MQRESRPELGADQDPPDRQRGDAHLSLDFVLESLRAQSQSLTEQERLRLAHALHAASADLMQGEHRVWLSSFG